jgi:hypothetical protein
MQQRRKRAAAPEAAGMTCQALLNRHRTALPTSHGQDLRDELVPGKLVILHK